MENEKINFFDSNDNFTYESASREEADFALNIFSSIGALDNENSNLEQCHIKKEENVYKVNSIYTIDGETVVQKGSIEKTEDGMLIYNDVERGKDKPIPQRYYMTCDAFITNSNNTGLIRSTMYFGVEKETEIKSMSFEDLDYSKKINIETSKKID